MAFHELQHLVSAHLAVKEDLAEQPWSDGFTRVDWHHGVPAVSMSKEMMAAPNSNNCETCQPQDGCQFRASEPGFRLMPR